ncbi:MAG: hypothetical protein E5X76_28950 [Mesorhizobium sp.]|nr:MAG: hypothetical protein E5X77_29195 [Mesorhizobium sp.]TJV68612.1 MAG: hypothetical protein E5X76_28950 [Mesorhizobium sp.]
MSKAEKRGACAHAEIKADKRGRVIMRADQAWRCLAPPPELPVMPVSITGAYGFKWPPGRRYVQRDDCAECPCWTERKVPAPQKLDDWRAEHVESVAVIIEGKGA